MSKALYPLAQELLFSAGSQPREAEELSEKAQTGPAVN